MPARYLLLALLVPSTLAISSSYLVGYSTGRHFSCQGTSCPPSTNTFSQSIFTALLNRLGSPSSSSEYDLPISADFNTQNAPKITLVVESDATIDSETLLTKLSTAASSESATSFIAPTEKLTSVGETYSVSQLETLATSEDVLRVSVGPSELSNFMDVVTTMKNRANGDVSILWSEREEEVAAKAEGDGAAEKPEGEGAGEKPAGDAEAGADTQDGGQKEEEKLDENAMRPPEIGQDGVAGLIVGFVFLLLFVPGFMCLWNIQTPQTFETIDSAEMKKKMQ